MCLPRSLLGMPPTSVSGGYGALECSLVLSICLSISVLLLCCFIRTGLGGQLRHSKHGNEALRMHTSFEDARLPFRGKVDALPLASETASRSSGYATHSGRFGGNGSDGVIQCIRRSLSCSPLLPSRVVNACIVPFLAFSVSSSHPWAQRFVMLDERAENAMISRDELFGSSCRILADLRMSRSRCRSKDRFCVVCDHREVCILLKQCIVHEM